MGGGKLELRVPGAAAGEFAGVRAEDGALVLGAASAAVELTLTALSSAEHTLAIDAAGATVDMSDDLYGIFYEDINYAADGGLYAELVRNRSFEFNSSDNSSFTGLTAWAKVDRNGATATTTVLTDAQRLNDTNRYYLRLDASAPGAGIRNAGYNTGLFLEKGEKYDVSVWARSAVGQDLTVQVEDAAGGTTYATGKVTVDGTDTWTKYTTTLTATETTSAAASLSSPVPRARCASTWSRSCRRTPGSARSTEDGPAQGPRREDRRHGPAVPAVPGRLRDQRRDVRHLPREQRRRPQAHVPVEGDHRTGRGACHELELLGLQPVVRDRVLRVLHVRGGPRGHAAARPVGRGQRLREHHPEMKDDVRIQRWVQDTLDLIEFANGDVTTEWARCAPSSATPSPSA
ncbi:carbohydrate binding domain-containing protein [Oerskovia sp. M15]